MTDGKQYSAEEIIDKIKRNMPFYTSGGITASGGEPMMQIDFLIELFELAKENGIHTCLDTSGIMYNPENSEFMEKIEKLTSLCDLVMLDIKHIDEDEHQKLTRHSNENILEFAKYLDKKPDMRAIKEMVEKPFMDATVANECVGFFTRKELNYTEYASVNDELYYSHGGENGRMAICHTASAENTVKYIANDVLFFEGSGVSLEAALGRYYKLKKAIQLGKSTQQELDQECKNYTAISPDVLDSAIDRRLDFAFSLKKCDGNIPLENEELVLRANRESTVMLKNDGHILPIAKKARVAIVGDIAMQEDSFEGSLCN
jgi:organic radical activating enzyme